jgi:hypothetical protein
MLIEPAIAMPTMIGKVKINHYIDNDSLLTFVGDKAYIKYDIPDIIKDSVASMFPLDLDISEKVTTLKISTVTGQPQLPEVELPLAYGSYPITIPHKEIVFNSPNIVEDPQLKKIVLLSGLLKLSFDLKRSVIQSTRLSIQIVNLYENEAKMNSEIPVYFKVEFDLSSLTAKKEAEVVLDDYIVDVSKKNYFDIRATLYTNAGAKAFSTEELTIKSKIENCKFRTMVGDLGIIKTPNYKFDFELPDFPLDNEKFQADADISFAKHNEFVELKSTFGVPMDITYNMNVDGKDVSFDNNVFEYERPQEIGKRVIDSIIINEKNSDIEDAIDLNSRNVSTNLSINVGRNYLDTTEFIEYDNFINGNFGMFMPLSLNIKKMKTSSYVEFDFDEFNVDDIYRGKFLFDITNEFELMSNFTIDFCETIGSDTNVIFSTVSVDENGDSLQTVDAAQFKSGILVPSTSRSYFHFNENNIDSIKHVKLLKLNFDIKTDSLHPLELDTSRGISFIINTIVELNKKIEIDN